MCVSEEMCYWMICPEVMFWLTILAAFAGSVFTLVWGIMKSNTTNIVIGSVMLAIDITVMIAVIRCTRCNRSQNSLSISV